MRSSNQIWRVTKEREREGGGIDRRRRLG